jgi:serine/tyrosine/threonine adenylyltransferase
MSLQTAPVLADQDSLPHPRIAAFDNSYARLPPHFFARQLPTQVAEPRLVKFNHALAAELQLDTSAIEAEGAAAIFAGNIIPEGADPIAAAYAGHQFGGFSPQLGDGRAILLGEVIDVHGTRRDIQLKGAGRTKFSRGGDGRAGIGPVLREYLVSEAMHALGIPTTRALAAVTTGEPVYRDRLLPGAIVTRVAASHMRIGTFQYFAARRDDDAIRMLADYAIARHYPDAQHEENPYLALFNSVLARQASLVARWMSVGFVHGVMNTDNMAISGETIDYGPCAFMESYDPATVFSAIDEGGRYAYANQPRIAHWNLARFAETLLPLFDAEPDRAVERATNALGRFGQEFEFQSLSAMRAKLGLTTQDEADRGLVAELLGLLHANKADFTLTFRALADAVETGQTPPTLQTLFADKAALETWLSAWRLRLSTENQPSPARAAAMRQVNPRYIPRNHRVEHALNAAIEDADYAPFETLLAVVTRPYDDQPGNEAFSRQAEPEERVLRTFCGT